MFKVIKTQVRDLLLKKDIVVWDSDHSFKKVVVRRNKIQDFLRTKDYAEWDEPYTNFNSGSRYDIDRTKSS